MTTLKSRDPDTRTRSTGRGIVKWILIGAAIVLVPIILLLAAVLFGRSGEDGAVPTSKPTETTLFAGDVTSGMMVFFLADYVEASNVPGPHLIAVERAVTWNGRNPGAQLEGAINALLDGPVERDVALIDGLATSLPDAVELLGWTLDNTGDAGVATLDFNQAFASTGDGGAITSRIAQVVYTATQIDEVDAVLFTIEGAPAELPAGGANLDGPQTRDDYRDRLPLIFSDNPLPGANLTSLFEISGVSNTFEATLQYRIETADGVVLADGFTTATCGTGCWGEYRIQGEYTLEQTTRGFVVLFEGSAEDGRPVNVVRIPVTLESSLPLEAVDIEIFAGLPGGAPLNGAVVVDRKLDLEGTANATELTVNGVAVPVIEGAFSTTLDLEPGINEILIQAGTGLYGWSVTYVPDGEIQFGFVDGYLLGDQAGTVTAPDGTVFTTAVLFSIDYAQWLSGDEANRAAEEDGVIQPGEGVPNDYYIRNQNDQLRSIPVADGADVLLVDIASVTPVLVDFDEWLDLIDRGGTGKFFGAGNPITPYWFVLDAGGYIVQVIQQYVP